MPTLFEIRNASNFKGQDQSQVHTDEMIADDRGGMRPSQLVQRKLDALKVPNSTARREVLSSRYGN